MNFCLKNILKVNSTGPDHVSAAQGIREVGEAVTHARFVGTNTSNDEVVLMRILNVSLDCNVNISKYI